MTTLASDGAIPFFTKTQLDQMYPSHGLNDPDWAWMQPRLTPQPIATYAQAPTTRPLDPDATRLAYVQCDHTTPPTDLSTQSPGWTHLHILAGHWPMITTPDALAEVITEAARA